jgi:hypothetical protein
MSGTTKRWAVFGFGVVLAGVLAGGVIAAQLRGVDDPEGFLAAVRDDPVIRVADFAGAAEASNRGVFVQSTSTGYLCLWDAPSASSRERQGGCDGIDDPLGGRKLSVSLSYDGGPEASRVSDARLIGLAAMDAASIQVLMTDGSRREIPMKRAAAVATQAGSFRAFGYRFRRADLRNGVGPTAVLALNRTGEEIDRQTTGFGG